jgi:hypothetical protein
MALEYSVMTHMSPMTNVSTRNVCEYYWEGKTKEIRTERKILSFFNSVRHRRHHPHQCFFVWFSIETLAMHKTIPFDSH